MKYHKYFVVIILAQAATFLHAQIDKTNLDYINTTFYPATVLLYNQEDDGSMKMRCTATAIEKNKTGYVFVSAAHCGCDDDTDNETVKPVKTFFYITLDDVKNKQFLSAKPTGCGYRHDGDDFMLFQVDTDKSIPVVKLGSDPDTTDQIVNVASPLGLGKQVFFGSVSGANLQRPVIVDDINWTNAIMLQLFGTDGGSSGSAVVCLDQKAICAFVVGSIDKSSIIAMPVSRLIKVREQIADDDYSYWQPKKKKKDSK